MSSAEFLIGVDIGSTTVKSVLVDPSSQEILWSRYERHETRQAATVALQLSAMQIAVPAFEPSRTRIFCTGSGAAALKDLLGAKFIQEVNAVTVAVETLHPDVGSVIELGGQDAKIIIYKQAATGTLRRAIASMNDKCASGTGATIDKCIAKVSLQPTQVATMPWDPRKLHHVAAKCGVFAETDIVNLIKSGIPELELLCSLGNAIVMQNLSVLTRGNTLRHRVLLLGGPNTYLHFLQGCWRQRIVELWDERGYDYPRSEPVEQLIQLPARAEFYAAFGAALFGLSEAPEVGRYRGLEALTLASADPNKSKGSGKRGPALVANETDKQNFLATYRLPPFEAPTLPAGTVRAFLGIDGGSTSSKAVLLAEDGSILCKRYQLSRGNPIADTKELLAGLEGHVREQHATLEILGVGVTGYAADVLEQTLLTDANVVETVAHMHAAAQYFDDVDVICDVGGQDIKVLFMQHGQVRNFRLSNQCSAGNGSLLQSMAAQFGIRMQDYSDLAFSATSTPIFNYGCAVFLDTDRVTFQKEGFTREELLAGLALVLPKNIWQYVVQVPRLATLGRVFVLQGGTQYNLAALKAQHDYIMERVPDAKVHVHPHCGEAGAIGAAIEARRVVKARGSSSFIGLSAAIGIDYTTRNDESTVCHFCPNLCQRTFIETKTPSGARSRYIAGFSCENGTVDSKEELKTIARTRKSLRNQFPNLVQYEAELAFKRHYLPDPLPPPSDNRRPYFKNFRFPARELAAPASFSARVEKRRQMKIGMPRVLNMYSTAPLWRAYFETLGIESSNVVFSDFTSEELWAAGGRYGSIDPCFPAKVCQAHVHDLLFNKHPAQRLNFIFFPCITRLSSFVPGMPDAASCPVVAGTPKVIRAAFTKESDYFKRAGIDYVDAAATLTEPHLLKRQMFEAWGERLAVTEQESNFAMDQGFEALRRFDAELQQRGRLMLETLEHENRVGILLLARPYHGDPGLNHGVLDEFQALGYPIFSIRSIPKDLAWLRRFFPELPPDADPLSIKDVWPEAYSTNSAEKVWAAKFAARHPNLVALDLSSFKCGNDAPTYGLIDNVISAARTPYSALHDIDANKPGGSIKIRVRTYEYTLKRHAEELKVLAGKRSELERKVEAKRRELYSQHQAKLDAVIASDPREHEQREVLNCAYQDYLDREPPIAVGRVPEPERGACETHASAEVVLPWPQLRRREQAIEAETGVEYEST